LRLEPKITTFAILDFGIWIKKHKTTSTCSQTLRSISYNAKPQVQFGNSKCDHFKKKTPLDFQTLNRNSQGLFYFKIDLEKKLEI